MAVKMAPGNVGTMNGDEAMASPAWRLEIDALAILEAATRAVTSDGEHIPCREAL
jgi:hypothetical protein